MVIRRPVGVCAAITPYNFPLTLLGTKVGPALAAGNTVVAKPAATTPLATLEVARLFSELGQPINSVSVSRPSLDDVFMSYTGKTIRDAEQSGDSDRRRAMARMMSR